MKKGDLKNSQIKKKIKSAILRARDVYRIGRALIDQELENHEADCCAIYSIKDISSSSIMRSLSSPSSSSSSSFPDEKSLIDRR